MNSIINSLAGNSRTRSAEPTTVEYRSPLYDCREQSRGLKLVVYVPGVDSAGVEIASRGPDLMVTARKGHVVRVNFNSLHLESAQRDYRLTLRLGKHLDYENLHAEINDGVLTILLPKRDRAEPFNRLRRVA